MLSLALYQSTTSTQGLSVEDAEINSTVYIYRKGFVSLVEPIGFLQLVGL